jgi:hypothetical protein
LKEKINQKIEFNIKKKKREKNKKDMNNEVAGADASCCSRTGKTS